MKTEAFLFAFIVFSSCYTDNIQTIESQRKFDTNKSIPDIKEKNVNPNKESYKIKVVFNDQQSLRNQSMNDKIVSVANYSLLAFMLAEKLSNNGIMGNNVKVVGWPEILNTGISSCSAQGASSQRNFVLTVTNIIFAVGNIGLSISAGSSIIKAYYVSSAIVQSVTALHKFVSFVNPKD